MSDQQLSDLPATFLTESAPATTPEATAAYPGPAGRGSSAPTVPGFEVLDVLGRGGMGVVYLARQAGLNRLVALKLILAGAHADDQQRVRFQHEAEAVARLQHPGIVQVHQIGDHDGMPYLVLEYVAGGSLARHLAGQPQPPTQAVAWTAALADAVHHAHCQGIVHRDLKPANVLLASGRLRLSGEEEFELKITDFGLAKKLDDDSGQTASGAILGTPSYMAPEQAQGRILEVGPAADIYALGAILYEMLTGRPPFRADTPLNTLRQVISDEPASPRVLNPAVPRDLETVCLKCLRKEAGRRYRTAAELADDLRRFQRGEPIQARAVGLAERGWRWVRRNPVVASLIAAVVLSLLLGMGGSLYYAGRAMREAALKEDEAQHANEASTRAQAEADNAQRQRYLAEMNLAAVAFRDGELARTRHLLDQWLPASGAPDRRGLEWPLLQRQTRGALHVLEQQTLAARTLGWHPSGDRLYFVRNGKLVAWDVAAGRPLFETAVPAMLNSLAVRPDGRQVALAENRSLHLFDAVSGARQFESPLGHDVLSTLRYRPEGRELLTGSADYHVRRLNPDTGRVHQTLPRQPVGHHAFVRGVGYVPGSDHVVSLDVYRWLIRWDAAGIPVWKIQVGQGVGVALAVHPRRPLAAVGFTLDAAGVGEQGKIELRDLKGGDLVAELAHNGGIQALAFSPDGMLLAAGGSDHVLRIWDVARAQLIAELTGHEGTIGALAWSPDGWRLASASGDRTVRIWTVRATALERAWQGASPVSRKLVLHPRGESVLLLGREEASRHVPLDGPIQELLLPDLAGPVGDNGEWSDDGRWLAVSAGRHAEIRDGKTLRLMRRLNDHSNTLSDLRFTPDGQSLLTACASGEVRLWETATGRLVRSWQVAASSSRLAVSACGRYVAVLSSRVWVYRLDTGAKLWEKPSETEGGYWPSGVFLRDGRLALGGHEGHIRIFNLSAEKPQQTLLSTPRLVTDLWAPLDGRRLLSQDDEGSLTIWDLETAQSLRVMRAITGQTTVAMDPAGRWLARRTPEGFALWDLRPWDAAGARRQEALALVDHLARLSMDRADLLRRVAAHPALHGDVRAEALVLARRYDDSPEALLWQTFDWAGRQGDGAEVYAALLPQAERVVRDLPRAPLARLTRGLVFLRLGRLEAAASDLQAAEKLFGDRADSQRIWSWRLQALLAVRQKRMADAKALTARADAARGQFQDRRDYEYAQELAPLLSRVP